MHWINTKSKSLFVLIGNKIGQNMYIFSKIEIDLFLHQFTGIIGLTRKIKKQKFYMIITSRKQNMIFHLTKKGTICKQNHCCIHRQKKY